MLTVDELLPGDAVNIYDEELNKYVIVRVARICNGEVIFIDGSVVKVYDKEAKVKVSRLQLVKNR